MTKDPTHVTFSAILDKIGPHALRLYTKLYGADVPPDDLLTLACRAYEHADLLESTNGSATTTFGLTTLQLGEGARRHARLIALRLAEEPAQAVEDIWRKLGLLQLMQGNASETVRSHAAVMVNAAVEADAARLRVAGTMPARDNLN